VTTSFDATSYSWTLRFLKHRIADMRILRLVAKWLRVGVVEAGRESSGRSAPQGAVISPILANIWRRHKATGDVIVVRYADDTIVGFEHEHEAQPFLHDLQERMGLFDLALHPEKPGWSHTAKQRAARGEGSRRSSTSSDSRTTARGHAKWGSFRTIAARQIIHRLISDTIALCPVTWGSEPTGMDSRGEP
jgi:hypothetical protein